MPTKSRGRALTRWCQLSLNSQCSPVLMRYWINKNQSQTPNRLSQMEITPQLKGA